MSSDPPYPKPAAEDVIQPFQIEASNLRGRLVRLGPALDEIITRHDYPEPVATILGKTVTLATALAALLKFDGIFTLQTSGDGPVPLMVADVTSTGDVRGYAKFNQERLDRAVAEDAVARDGEVPALLGSGYLAFTVDPGGGEDRYQGIVELTGETLADCARHYFRQSEQLDTGIQLAIDRSDGTPWRGAAIIVQKMPDQETTAHRDRRDDDWSRAMMLLNTSTPEEMLDPGLAVNDLLFRLFHEDGVRVYTPSLLRHGCRCSRERVLNVLQSLTADELTDLSIDGVIEVTCEFCNVSYSFPRDDIPEGGGDPPDD